MNTFILKYNHYAYHRSLGLDSIPEYILLGNGEISYGNFLLSCSILYIYIYKKSLTKPQE
jgi:hypothetical protein